MPSKTPPPLKWKYSINGHRRCNRGIHGVVGDAVARYAEVGNTAVVYAGRRHSGKIRRRSRMQIWNIRQPTAGHAVVGGV
ncbi:hypothetical protein P8452_38743 [Trifolium repens]|nr:hypothetical protein P8452_38743 [Trifolium repens]